MDKTKIDLNAPAFGAGAQKLEDLINDAHAQEASVEVKPVVESHEEGNDTSDEETKVPYSRFKKFHDEARQARQEAEEWRAKAEALESRPVRREIEESLDMPSYWRELYGDSEASQKAWSIQQRREEEIEQRAYEAGQRGARELEIEQRERIESNVNAIDDNFEDLSEFIGRDLTAKEQSAILDIVDDYTAKDRDGNYQGAIMPFDKAWEIYELKQGSVKSSQRKDRDVVASLSGTSSQGDTSGNEEQNKSWNPLARGTWRSRL
jgi:hypothetical protein